MYGSFKKDPWLVKFLLKDDWPNSAEHLQVIKTLQGPLDDGSVLKEITDGTNVIAAHFTAEAVQEWKNKCEEDDMEADDFDGHVIVKKFHRFFVYNQDKARCLFLLKIEAFQTWGSLQGFFSKSVNYPHCMHVATVQRKAQELWEKSNASTEDPAPLEQSEQSNVSLSVLLNEMAKDSQLSISVTGHSDNHPDQSEGTDKKPIEQRLPSNMLVSYFIISDDDKLKLDALPEWKFDYRPPTKEIPSPSTPTLRKSPRIKKPEVAEKGDKKQNAEKAKTVFADCEALPTIMRMAVSEAAQEKSPEGKGKTPLHGTHRPKGAVVMNNDRVEEKRLRRLSQTMRDVKPASGNLKAAADCVGSIRLSQESSEEEMQTSAKPVESVKSPAANETQGFIQSTQIVESSQRSRPDFPVSPVNAPPTAQRSATRRATKLRKDVIDFNLDSPSVIHESKIRRSSSGKGENSKQRDSIDGEGVKKNTCEEIMEVSSVREENAPSDSVLKIKRLMEENPEIVQKYMLQQMDAACASSEEISSTEEGKEDKGNGSTTTQKSPGKKTLDALSLNEALEVLEDDSKQTKESPEELRLKRLSMTRKKQVSGESLEQTSCEFQHLPSVDSSTERKIMEENAQRLPTSFDEQSDNSGIVSKSNEKDARLADPAYVLPTSDIVAINPLITINDDVSNSGSKKDTIKEKEYDSDVLIKSESDDGYNDSPDKRKVKKKKASKIMKGDGYESDFLGKSSDSCEERTNKISPKTSAEVECEQGFSPFISPRGIPYRRAKKPVRYRESLESIGSGSESDDEKKTSSKSNTDKSHNEKDDKEDKEDKTTISMKKETSKRKIKKAKPLSDTDDDPDFKLSDDDDFQSEPKRHKGKKARIESSSQSENEEIHERETKKPHGRIGIRKNRESVTAQLDMSRNMVIGVTPKKAKFNVDVMFKVASPSKRRLSKVAKKHRLFSSADTNLLAPIPTDESTARKRAKLKSANSVNVKEKSESVKKSEITEEEKALDKGSRSQVDEGKDKMQNREIAKEKDMSEEITVHESSFNEIKSTKDDTDHAEQAASKNKSLKPPLSLDQVPEIIVHMSSEGENLTEDEEKRPPQSSESLPLAQKSPPTSETDGNSTVEHSVSVQRIPFDSADDSFQETHAVVFLPDEDKSRNEIKPTSDVEESVNVPDVSREKEIIEVNADDIKTSNLEQSMSPENKQDNVQTDEQSNDEDLVGNKVNASDISVARFSLPTPQVSLPCYQPRRSSIDLSSRRSSLDHSASLFTTVPDESQPFKVTDRKVHSPENEADVVVTSVNPPPNIRKAEDDIQMRTVDNESSVSTDEHEEEEEIECGKPEQDDKDRNIVSKTSDQDVHDERDNDRISMVEKHSPVLNNKEEDKGLEAIVDKMEVRDEVEEEPQVEDKKQICVDVRDMSEDKDVTLEVLSEREISNELKEMFAVGSHIPSFNCSQKTEETLAKFFSNYNPA